MAYRFLLLLLSLLVEGSATSIGISAHLREEHSKIMENRRQSFAVLADPYRKIPKALLVHERPAHLREPAAWVRQIKATVFWIGEQPTENNPVPNDKSAWDTRWQETYGGYDDPHQRRGYRPASFEPKANPFYVALPYNDVIAGGKHRPEAAQVVPWFWEDYKGPGISVLKGRWIAIEYEGRMAFAQWEDVGPFEIDHWQYVFGHERPRGNRNQSAGIDISPAIRDYLRIKGGYATVNWRFVDLSQVIKGPWSNWVDDLPSW